MSSFKEIKKRNKIKPNVLKVKRLYACESLAEDDFKYLHTQFNLYDKRKWDSILLVLF